MRCRGGSQDALWCSSSEYDRPSDGEQESSGDGGRTRGVLRGRWTRRRNGASSRERCRRFGGVAGDRVWRGVNGGCEAHRNDGCGQDLPSGRFFEAPVVMGSRLEHHLISQHLALPERRLIRLEQRHRGQRVRLE